MSELLFEIGTEEIPAGYIQPALQTLGREMDRKLRGLGLHFHGIETYGTPRRLTLIIQDLESRQPDQRLEHIGPSRSAGFDADGNPTKAAIGFARSKGKAPESLEVVETPKGEYLMVIEEVQGQDSIDLLPDLLESLIREIVFPKSMRWSETCLAFARPIQWIVALFDGSVIDLEIEGVVAGNTSRGHRFLASGNITISGIAQYRQAMADHFVIVDMQQRRKMVINEVEHAVREQQNVPGAQPVLHDGLIDTVTNLVEKPYGICGSFDEKFLQLPDEALITSMREHQKYFPVTDSTTGKLLPYFVAVNNTEIADTKFAASGHERVLRARLEDGLFFYKEDQKEKLETRIERLSGIVFQHKLGTMLEKSERVAKLAEQLAEAIQPELKVEAVRAARLAKADLLTEMVGEFPSLQGIMGREYATRDGEPLSVAQAIEEHYMPVRSGGELPGSILGAIVGIADRLDTIAGCFAIGERPTGNKDAFGLRRQAIGLINILKGLSISIKLSVFVDAALQGYVGQLTIENKTAEDILAFISLRFANEQVASGFPQEVVDAATAIKFDDPVDCLARIEALNQIQGQEQFAVLAGSFKRIRNIIKDNSATTVDTALLQEQAEKDLFQAFEQVETITAPLLNEKKYSQALEEMLAMKTPVDTFFDQVMVMAEDASVRQNRLNMLTALGQLVLQVGDISRMHVE
ncbi:glycine--tRNA ligase subunit beta [Desulfogranum japonicum]|uniref:glycine--tRNA ligase subunit beta n=1 Tax=Desulfogranum japonicum TaxID=231447 RepID=UPI00041BC8FD|nr:glycine--tRNA ligase subunit beta [Desulfogranum japonicum]